MADKKWNKQKRKAGDLEERKIITGMITSTDFLRNVKSFLKIDLFPTILGKAVSTWCLDYFEKYEKAPVKDIQNIFMEKKKSGLYSDEHIDLIELFLLDISQYEDENFNVDYFIDRAVDFFKLQSLKKLAHEINGYVLDDNPLGAEVALVDYKTVSKNESNKGVLLLDDIDFLSSVFVEGESPDVLFSFPGDLGKLIGPLYRKRFLSFAGPRKRGKSYWLGEIGLRAVMRGLKVVFYSLEQSNEEVAIRDFQWFLAAPKETKTVYIPIFDCKRNQTGECREGCGYGENIDFDFDDKKAVRDLDLFKKYPDHAVCNKCRKKKKGNWELSTWWKKTTKEEITMDRVLKKAAILKKAVGNNLKLIAAPAKTVTVKDIENDMMICEDEGFCPDVIIVDYADILAQERGQRYNEKRHQIDDTWTALKSLAQKRNALVVTATHSNKQTLNRKIKEGDSSEHIGKENVVDALITLNQTTDQKRMGIMEIGVTAERHIYYDMARSVYVLEQRDIGRPFLDSQFNKK